MKKIYYIGHFSNLNDGGQARIVAFREYYIKKGATVLNVYSKNILIRFSLLLRVLKLLIFSKSNEIFLHQGSFLVLFPTSILGPFFYKKIFKLLQRTAKRNHLIIEINDLPYEQAIDLSLPVDELYLLVEDMLYPINNCKYIFASHQMALFASRKYGINDLNYSIVINGANELKGFPDTNQIPSCLLSSEIKYVYAGSLNKGRQIEDLISLFRDRKELLILLGEWGEWIKELPTSGNIHYIGKHNEDYAQFLVSKCDIGLIPYDDTKFYYNLCYPTKASFYICAGIPFLSTPLKELMYVFNDYQMTYFVPFGEWPVFIDNNKCRNQIREIKSVVHKNKSNFYWKSLLINENFPSNF